MSILGGLDVRSDCTYPDPGGASSARFGHGAKICRTTLAICINCGDISYDEKSTREAHCINCEVTIQLILNPRTHWSITVSFCQFSDWQLLISCIFGSNGTLYISWKFPLLLVLPILLPKIHEVRSLQSLNWQKLVVTDQSVRGFTNALITSESAIYWPLRQKKD